MKILNSFILTLVLLLLASCSASLKQTIPVPEISLSKLKADNTLQANQAYVFVNTFQDMRPATFIAESKDKKSDPATALGPIVQQTISRALEQQGFIISESAPLILSGDITSWIANISTGMPSSSVSSKAALKLEVFDPANKRIYSGAYEGFMDLKNITISEKDVQEALSGAMAQAISQIINDKKLLSLLTAF